MSRTATHFSLAGKAQPSFDKVSVAALSQQEIVHMGLEELVRVIETARIPTSCTSRLAFKDRATLERLAHLARRSCRNQGY